MTARSEPPRQGALSEASPQAEAARQACLRLLGYRARSRAELGQRLRRRGFEERVIAAVLDRLQGEGLVDDEAFARAWVQSRLAGRPRGARALRWELRAKGVSEELIRRALAAEMAPQQEMEAALKVAARYGRRPGEDEAARRRRLVGALKRRGFTYEIIDAVLAREGEGG